MSNANEKIEKIGEKLEQFIQKHEREKNEQSIKELNQRVNSIIQESKEEIEKIKIDVLDKIYNLENRINKADQSNRRWFISLLVSIILGVAGIIFTIIFS